MTHKPKIGILGMSGNPVHLGHIELAKTAKERLGLNEVWLMITPYNTLENKDYAAFHHRFTMARLIAKESGALGDGLWVSDFEFNLATPSGTPQTIDMLRAFQHAYPDWQPVWLMGADCLTHFHRWFAWQEIIQNFPMAMFARGGSPLQQANSEVREKLQGRQKSIADFQAQPGAFCLFEKEVSPLTSRAIRADLANKGVPSGISQSVFGYIQKYNLYGYK